MTTDSVLLLNAWTLHLDSFDEHSKVETHLFVTRRSVTVFFFFMRCVQIRLLTYFDKAVTQIIRSSVGT